MLQLSQLYSTITPLNLMARRLFWCKSEDPPLLKISKLKHEVRTPYDLTITKILTALQ